MRSDITPWTIRGIGLALGVLIVYVIAQIGLAAGNVLLLTFLSVLLASALEPIVGWLGELGGDLGQEPVLLQRVVPVVVRSERSRWPVVTFVDTVPAGLPTVVADPTYVEQVLRNLLSNAAKYGGQGSTVSVVLEHDAGEVAVRILDDGPGVKPEEAERVFDLFYRSPSTAGTTSDAGIGLFVCARLVAAMGGRIWARRRPEGGSEFGFALRVMKVD